MRRESVAGRRSLPRLGRIGSYFREVVGELKKVVWPTRQETRRLTLMVLGIAGAVAVLLGAFDVAFSYLVNLFW